MCFNFTSELEGLQIWETLNLTFQAYFELHCIPFKVFWGKSDGSAIYTIHASR